MGSLDETRKNINEIDKQMAQLFEKRMQAVAEVAAEKAKKGLPILNAKRETEVINRNLEYIESGEVKEFYTNFIKYTMELSRNYQRRILDGYKVAFSGVEGAFAFIAAKKIFPYGTPVAYKSFASAYQAVATGECDAAVLPIENSYAGDVEQVMDLAYSGDLYINCVYNLEIVQNLLGVEGATPESIKKVISHPQALNQCDEYISKMGYEREEFSNTAVAAKEVAKLNSTEIAAIASEETANIYGLKIIEKAINKSSRNTTRFAVFSRIPNEKGGHGRFVMFFRVKDEAGALSSAISVISKNGFNMQAIKSHPTKDHAFNYYFFVECIGDIYGEAGKKLQAELSSICSDLKIAEIEVITP